MTIIDYSRVLPGVSGRLGGANLGQHLCLGRARTDDTVTNRSIKVRVSRELRAGRIDLNEPITNVLTEVLIGVAYRI